MIPFIWSFSLWSKKVNLASLVTLKSVRRGGLSFSFVTVDDAVMRDILYINMTLNLECSSNLLLLGIFQYVRHSVSFLVQRK